MLLIYYIYIQEVHEKEDVTQLAAEKGGHHPTHTATYLR